MSVEIRPATLDDRENVVSFTDDTWSSADDYVPRVFDEWVERDGSDRRTLVADADGRAVGLCQGVLLTGHEAWAQGMRVDPEFRGRGIGTELTEAVFAWAADRGATVCRNMVFSWNAAGLGNSRAVGFEPVTQFRWLHPEPRAVAPDLDVVSDPDAAWTHVRRSDAAAALGGLGLDLEESWAVAELTRERLAEAESVLAVADSERIRGATYRTRTHDRESDSGEVETWAEYGIGAWSDLAALKSLSDAVAADADAIGADRTRLLVPDTARHVSDAAAAMIEFSEDTDFVLEAELTRR